LRESGAVVERALAFPDHHPYSAADLRGIRKEAESLGLQAVTTEKDLARIASMDLPDPWPGLMALPVQLCLDDEAGLRNFILRRIEGRRLRPESPSR
jgi:tetraacyldisaccharide 4'-kinase